MDQQIIAAKKLLENSDAVLISASNGLSIAEGYNIFADDDNFRKYFNDFKALFGIQSLIQGAFAQIPESDHRIFMRQIHKYLIDDYQPTMIFQNLKKIIGEKEYFVLTSNADTHFQMNDFSDQSIWEIEGNFDGLDMNTTAWKNQKSRFDEFLKKYADKKVVQLELGIGANNQMIKAPLMEMVANNDKWSFVTLNMPDSINVPANIQAKSIALPGDVGTTFEKLLTR